MTIPLENLADGSISDRNFQTLARLVLETGGRSLSVRAGVANVIWPGGSAFGGVTSVNHGLGKTPLLVLVTANSFIAAALGYTSVLGATSFSLSAWSPSGALGAGTTVPFGWVAVG